jgi:ribosomal protein S18
MDAERDFEMNDLVAGDLGKEKGQRRMTRRRPRQIVPDYVDWKDVDFLKRFIPERGKIMPRRISGISAKDQRRIAQAIKRARSMALLPYVAD